MNKIYYMCKYTPLEILESFGFDTERLDPAPQNFDCADSCAHPNLCGYGKAVIEEVNSKDIKALVLIDCCDVCRRIYDVLKERGGMDFLYLMPLPHKNGPGDAKMLEGVLKEFVTELREYTGEEFDKAKLKESCAAQISYDGEDADDRAGQQEGGHISLTGAHGGALLKEIIKSRTDIPVFDNTCTGLRQVHFEGDEIPENPHIMYEYAKALLNQKNPCMRMQFKKGAPDENALGIICHTVKFCDYYGFEYRHLKNETNVPVLKIETDLTPSSSGQIYTRIDAFAEAISPKTDIKENEMGNIKYAAGIDSGSSSTDAVVMDADKNILGKAILPTGAGAASGADKALEAALKDAGLSRDDIDAVVTTGYGRETIGLSDKSVTEISCHAKGAHFLYPKARTVIDIGGQDSKVISLDEDGNVENFVMNDKCAAGTGRFLEMMARTLNLSLPEMSRMGLAWENDITISSMCTVFAESEVVSLIADNTSSADIIHGLNEAVASKTVSLARRLKAKPSYVMTGGVAQNRGVVKSLEEKLGEDIYIPGEAQLCGALGAALYAMEGRG